MRVSFSPTNLPRWDWSGLVRGRRKLERPHSFYSPDQVLGRIEAPKPGPSAAQEKDQQFGGQPKDWALPFLAPFFLTNQNQDIRACSPHS
jgi:hypothetical protein